MIGTKLGSYVVVKALGEDGMGTDYLAEHELLGRKAAVKVLRPELSRHKEVVERFFNEARAATQIQHGGIVDVFDFGFADGGAYLIMEYLDGESLADRMGRLGQMEVTHEDDSSSAALTRERDRQQPPRDRNRQPRRVIQLSDLTTVRPKNRRPPRSSGSNNTDERNEPARPNRTTKTISSFRGVAMIALERDE